LTAAVAAGQLPLATAVKGNKMSARPTIAARAPIAVTVVAGQSYWWCACGLSKSQPFCDGSHQGTEFAPQEFKAEDDEELWFCSCKHSRHQPLCDGSHAEL
jgi:CDGSH-type Zn-finger protein